MKKLFLSVIMTVMLLACASAQYPYAYDEYPSYERYLVEFYSYCPQSYCSVYYTYYFYVPYHWNYGWSYGWNSGWYSWYYPYVTPYWNYYGYGAYSPYWGGNYNYWGHNYGYSGYYSGWNDEWHGFHDDGMPENTYYGPRTDEAGTSGPQTPTGSQTGSSGASVQYNRQNARPMEQTPVNTAKRDENAKPVQTYTYPRPQNGNSPNSYNYNYVRPSGGSTGTHMQTRPSSTQRPAGGAGRNTATQRPSSTSSGSIRR